MKRQTKEAILLSIVCLTVILNAVLIGVLTPGVLRNALRVVGWILFGIGAALVILSIATLRSKGTGAVIDTGIYAVVRHPMYLSGAFFYIGHVLFCPHWIVALVAIVGMVCVYWIMILEEKSLVEKFGDAYERYMESVPRANLLIGVARLLRRKDGG
jgi:protein-S-isoprenylcysteine O-methyltransferase Ste14